MAAMCVRGREGKDTAKVAGVPYLQMIDVRY